MTMFDRFQSKNIDELIEWLDEYCMLDCAPWITWFDMNYCKDCESVIADEKECSWCELHNKCKYFKNMQDIPESKQIIKMWLEREV